MPPAIPLKVREIEALEAEVKRLRKRVAEMYPLEEAAIWQRACQIHADTRFSLEESVAVAQAEVLLAEPGPGGW